MKTLKAVVAKYNQTSLILRILIGLAVGSVLALVAPGAGWVGELGSLFVGALKGIAPVLVFVIVASALAQGSSKLDRRFGTVIWLYMLTTFLAAAIAVITSFMFPVKVVLADAAQSDVIPQGLPLACMSKRWTSSSLLASASKCTWPLAYNLNTFTEGALERGRPPWQDGICPKLKGFGSPWTGRGLDAARHETHTLRDLALVAAHVGCGRRGPRASACKGSLASLVRERTRNEDH